MLALRMNTGDQYSSTAFSPIFKSEIPAKALFSISEPQQAHQTVHRRLGSFCGFVETKLWMKPVAWSLGVSNRLTGSNDLWI